LISFFEEYSHLFLLSVNVKLDDDDDDDDILIKNSFSM